MFKRPKGPQINAYMAFFIYSATLGTIFPRLGDMQIKMGISEGALGLALIGLAFGTQIGLMFAGPIIEKIGYRTGLIVGIPMLGFSEFAATLASTPLVFFLCLVVGGLAIGAIEIIANLEADRTEALIGRRIMSRSHAFWSFGFFVAGFVGGGIAQLGISPAVHTFGVSVISVVASYAFFKNFTPAPKRNSKEAKTPKFVVPTRGVLMIVVFTLSAMMLEGAASDWSVIFMRDIFETAPFINGIALAIGALAQGIMRYFADGFIDKHSPVKVAKTLILTLGVGTVMVTLAANPVMAIFGFCLMGIGTSAIFPLAMSAAAQRTDRSPATNVAAVAQLSFIVFLLAPPMLGYIAEHWGIRLSFGVGLPLIVVSWFATSSLVSETK